MNEIFFNCLLNNSWRQFSASSYPVRIMKVLVISPARITTKKSLTSATADFECEFLNHLVNRIFPMSHSFFSFNLLFSRDIWLRTGLATLDAYLIYAFQATGYN